MYGISTSKREKGRLFHEVVSIGATRVLEIGAFRGETTAVLSRAAACAGGYVVVIDPMRWSSRANDVREWLGAWFAPLSYEAAFWRNVHRAGHDNVRLIRRLSTDRELAARRDPSLAEFDAVFIDGDHSYDVVRSDLDRWGRRVRAGGTILLHDAVARFAGIVRAIREWESDPRVRVRWRAEESVCAIDVLSSLRPSHA